MYATPMEWSQKLFQSMEDLDLLHSQGLRLLQSFQQDLEHFRRPPLIKPDGGVLADLVKSAESPGLAAYQEAGCRKSDEDRSLVVRLDSTQCQLREHVQKNAAILEDMERIRAEQEASFERTSPAEDTCTCAIEDDLASDEATDDVRTQSAAPAAEETMSGCSYHTALFDSGQAIMGRALLTMYRKDVDMKGLIIGDLRLDTPTHLLRAYNIMWGLRPCISNEAVEEYKKWSESAG